jgi:CheY-like chemotaxis protein
MDARAVIGKKLGQVVHHLATDGTQLPEAESPILAPLKDAKAHHATDQIFGRMDGSYVPVDYVSTPMIDRDQLTGVVVSFNDITARHRSEAALQQRHRMLEETLLQLKTTQQQMLQQERLRAMGQMVVDDDPVVRKSVVAQLNTQAYTVETASNGREGLDRFEAGRFDLVVTDRAMPEMGGDQLAATIEQSAPATPVIMLTGFGGLMAATGEHPVGVDAVVSKPVTLDALTEAILKVVGRR